MCVPGKRGLAGGWLGVGGIQPSHEAQRRAESWLKMDHLLSPLTVNGGPEVSFLRAEREVVRLPHFIFLRFFRVSVVQLHFKQSLLPPGDSQPLLRRHRDVHGQAAADGGGCHGAQPAQEEKQEEK